MNIFHTTNIGQKCTMEKRKKGNTLKSLPQAHKITVITMTRSVSKHSKHNLFKAEICLKYYYVIYKKWSSLFDFSHGFWFSQYNLFNWRIEHTLNPLSANFKKWSNTLKQFVGNLPTNCLSVFDHFVGLALKGLSILKQQYYFVTFWLHLLLPPRMIMRKISTTFE